MARRSPADERRKAVPVGVGRGEPAREGIAAGLAGEGLGLDPSQRVDAATGPVEVAVLLDGAKTTHVIADVSAEVVESLAMPEGSTARQADGFIELVDPAGVAGGRWTGGAVTDSSEKQAETVATMELVGAAEDGTVTARAVVDAGWLASPERVWPVRVDPTVNRTTGEAHAGDTFVQSNIVNTAQWSSPDLKVGRTFDGLYLRQSLLSFQPNIPAGATVLDADLWMWESSSPSCSARQWTIHANTSSFGPGTV